MYNFLWQTVLIFPIYILFTKRIETFWFRDFSNTRDIRTYCFKYFQVYILVHLYQNQKKHLNYSKRFVNYKKCHKDFNTLKWYTLKALLIKNSVPFLFSHPLARKSSTIYWDATLLALILHLSFFKCFVFFKFNIPSQKSDNNNSIRIICIKIIIKIDITKIIINSTHFITQQYPFQIQHHQNLH